MTRRNVSCMGVDTGHPVSLFLEGNPMTEEQIERRVEKMVDHLDRVFLAGGMSQGDYDKAMRELDQWASAKLKEGKPQ